MKVPTQTIISLMKHMANHHILSLQVGDIHLTMDPSGFKTSRPVATQADRHLDKLAKPERSLEEMIGDDPNYLTFSAGINR